MRREKRARRLRGSDRARGRAGRATSSCGRRRRCRSSSLEGASSPPTRGARARPPLARAARRSCADSGSRCYWGSRAAARAVDTAGMEPAQSLVLMDPSGGSKRPLRQDPSSCRSASTCRCQRICRFVAGRSRAVGDGVRRRQARHPVRGPAAPTVAVLDLLRAAVPGLRAALVARRRRAPRRDHERRLVRANRGAVPAPGDGGVRAAENRVLDGAGGEHGGLGDRRPRRRERIPDRRSERERVRIARHRRRSARQHVLHAPWRLCSPTPRYWPPPSC